MYKSGEWLPECDNPIIDRKIRRVRDLGTDDLSVTDVRQIVGYFSDDSVKGERGLIGRHLVVAAKVCGSWRIDAESLIDYLKTLPSTI